MLFVFSLFDQESKYLLQLWETGAFRKDTTAVQTTYAAASGALISVEPVTEASW